MEHNGHRVSQSGAEQSRAEQKRTEQNRTKQQAHEHDPQILAGSSFMSPLPRLVSSLSCRSHSTVFVLHVWLAVRMADALVVQDSNSPGCRTGKADRAYYF